MQTILLALGKVLLSILMSLLTESFIKKLIVHGLEKLASLTETDADNKIVRDIREEWGLKDPS